MTLVCSKGDAFGFLWGGELQVTIQAGVKQMRAGDIINLTRHIPSQWKNNGEKSAFLY